MFSTSTLPKTKKCEHKQRLTGKAKALNINLSATLETALAEQLRIEQRIQWKAENAKAIQAYNSFVEGNGVFSDGLRKF